jgi:transposase
MEAVVTIGLDIAKSVFQVHGVDGSGAVVARRRLTRAKVLPFFERLPPCLVGLEACATAHYWGRELRKLGHDVRLMPPSYVKPYVKRQKNDAADAEGICEAVTRASMRFVEIKTPEQQSIMSLHRVRQMLMRQRTQVSNAIRGHLGEFGRVAPIGRNGLAQLIAIVADPNDNTLPAEVRAAVAMLVVQLRLVNEQILELDRRVRASARATDVGRRLMEVPGVGRCWRALSSRRFPIRERSSPVGTWRRGSGSFLGRTPAGARNDYAGSRSKAIATCDRCWWWEHWLSSDTRNGMEPADHGWCNSSRGGRPRSPPLHSPTRRHG